MSNSFEVVFRDCVPLRIDVDDSDLGNRWYELVRTVWHREGTAIFRDHPRYTPRVLTELANIANTELGWNWNTNDITLENTTRMHKDIERFLDRGFHNIPAHLDDLLHELHFALHAVESGSQRNSWLQIEWYADDGFEISESEYPAQIAMQFGDIRLQNPHVGHHPLFVYQQRDHRDIAKTCRLHDLARPGICIVVDRDAARYQLDWHSYRTWFEYHAADWVNAMTWQRIKAYTGHPVIGRVRNVRDLDVVLREPYLEFDRLDF